MTTTLPVAAAFHHEYIPASPPPADIRPSPLHLGAKEPVLKPVLMPFDCMLHRIGGVARLSVPEFRVDQCRLER